VANAGSDTITVIATETDTVVETISLRWRLQISSGPAPMLSCSIALAGGLFVCNGTQNAVAVVDFARQLALAG